MLPQVLASLDQFIGPIGASLILLKKIALVRHSGFIKSIATAPKLDEEA
jgi:hypothetical protein